MTEIIGALREEHRNIEKLLLVLEQEFSVSKRKERPGYHLVRSVIDHLQDYLESCHHRTEDMIFEKLKLRDPIAATGIGDLKAEHRRRSEHLWLVARTLESILAERGILRQTVDEIMRAFVDQERQHMAMEDCALFPTAAKVLLPQDWAEITERFAARRGHFSDAALEGKYRALGNASCNRIARRRWNGSR